MKSKKNSTKKWAGVAVDALVRSPFSSDADHTHTVESRRLHLEEIGKRPTLNGEWDAARDAERRLCEDELSYALARIESSSYPTAPERFERGDKRMFHWREYNGGRYEVYSIGMTQWAECIDTKRARVVADALELFYANGPAPPTPAGIGRGQQIKSMKSKKNSTKKRAGAGVEATVRHFSEKTIIEPGWYFFYPSNPDKYEQPKFVKVDQDSIDGKWLECKQYAGTYIGPYIPPPNVRNQGSAPCTNAATKKD